MMKIFEKEKKVVDLVMSHIDKTGECLDVAAELLERSLSGSDQQTEISSVTVGNLEGQADHLLREIRELLYSGAYLPLLRGDIYRLLRAVDEVANKSEDSCDIYSLQTPRVAAEFRPAIIEIIELTKATFGELREALAHFFKPKGDMTKLRVHLKNVSELESAIDTLKRNMTKRIFESELPMGHKLHLQQFLASLAHISDVAEDAADELDVVSVKSVV